MRTISANESRAAARSSRGSQRASRGKMSSVSHAKSSLSSLVPRIALIGTCVCASISPGKIAASPSADTGSPGWRASTSAAGPTSATNEPSTRSAPFSTTLRASSCVTIQSAV